MLDEPHVDVAGQEGELDGTKFGEGLALAATTGSDRLAPYRRQLFPERPVLDLQQTGKELRDFRHAIDG